ncbi:putative LRR receptor-like serine/threonine-protein kinase [Forsythia ovata]|uniref:LRR receptor-like serine/threonine-protein kinase n=1 Tax=Forsythia ovata TaxID=205694 RepID=A0ABD1S1Z8_9LAMI
MVDTLITASNIQNEHEVETTQTPNTSTGNIDVTSPPELNHSSNFLGGSIPSEIINLQAAILVYLSLNQFSGIIPSTIGELQKLVTFSLEHNKLQRSIHDSIGRMLNLENLDLFHNSHCLVD